MGAGNTKRGMVYARPIRVLIICSAVTCVSFCLILGMCLAFASTVAQLGRAIDEAFTSLFASAFTSLFASIVGYLLLGVSAWPSLTVVGLLAFTFAAAWCVLTGDWGELAWLFLALLGWFLSEGAL
jgi:hypothetical protein